MLHARTVAALVMLACVVPSVFAEPRENKGAQPVPARKSVREKEKSEKQRATPGQREQVKEQPKEGAGPRKTDTERKEGEAKKEPSRMFVNEKLRAQVKEKFDADNDGKLNPEERAKAKQSASERAERTKALLDRDGDGKVSPEEWRAADPDGKSFEDRFAEFARTMPERAKGEFMKRWDTDGDGTLSDAEKEAIRALWQQEAAERLAKFDANGDGKLDADERKTMVGGMKTKGQERREERHEPSGDRK